MMKMTRTGMAAVMAVGLLAGATAATSGSVLAQQATDERVAPSWFDIENLGPNGDDEMGTWTEESWGTAVRGDVRPNYWIVADDSRASGNWTRHLDSDAYGDPDADLIVIETSSQELQNSNGRWAGTGITYGAFGPDGPPAIASWAELTGEGDYAGLTLVMSQTENSWRGIILPTGQVPPMPEPIPSE